MEPAFVEANGVRFAYLAQGTGPLVLLLHGFPDTAWTWDRALPALATAGFRAVAPFTRGYHPTAIPADGRYDLATLAADAIALIGALGEERAILVGHDWGAAAAYKAAATRPEALRLLVTFAIPHPGALRPTPALAWAVRHMLALRLPGAATRTRARQFAYLDELWHRWSPGWDVPAAETAAVKRAFAQPGSLEAAIAYYRANGPRDTTLTTPITVPTIAFAGESDLVAPRVYEKARRWFASSYEVIQVPGGHFMHREHADHVIPELVRAIREHAAP